VVSNKPNCCCDSRSYCIHQHRPTV